MAKYGCHTSSGCSFFIALHTFAENKLYLLVINIDLSIVSKLRRNFLGVQVPKPESGGN